MAWRERESEIGKSNEKGLARWEERGRQHLTPAFGQGKGKGRVKFRQDVLKGLAGFHRSCSGQPSEEFGSLRPQSACSIQAKRDKVPS